MKPVISGIQQIGIGNPSVHEAWKWYREKFGMDVSVFEEAAEADLMLPYTGGVPHKRHAVLAINMNGGGGFEIWQYTSRKPEAAKFKIQYGDLGIYAAKIKSRNAEETFAYLKKKNVAVLGEMQKDPAGEMHFFIEDLYGNIFEIVHANDWFGHTKYSTGGVFGAIIGVSDIDKSAKFYSDILGYDKIIYDKTDVFDDVAMLPSGNEKCRRLQLTHSKKRKGAFSNLLGSSAIELVQVYNRQQNKIFSNRYWGDMGFIHLCFDIAGMSEMEKLCNEKGFPFTVNSSADFDMGDAAGHFAYVEDPDGTLIEFVETHKVPVLKKLGWYLNLKNRNAEKPLPNWMVKALGLNRKKD